MSSYAARQQSTTPSHWPQNSFTQEDNNTHRHVAKQSYPTSSPAATTVQPSQRSGSFTSTSAFSRYPNSLNPHSIPTEQTSPAFSLDDYLTPNSWSEDPISEASQPTSPGRDNGWQENSADLYSLNNPKALLYDDSNHNDFVLTSTLNGAVDVPLFNKHDKSTGLYAQDQLMTPHTTNTATPEPTTHHSVNLSVNTSAVRSVTGRQSPGRFEPAMFQELKRSRSPSENRQTTNMDQSIPQAVSPVVLISSYNRGDSPARSQVPLARSLSKRSQSSRLGDELASHHEDQWADNDEEEDDDDGRSRRHRAGVAPTQRQTEVVTSLNDMDKQRALDEKSVDVRNWLASSVPGSPTGSDSGRNGGRMRDQNRLRSRSTGMRFDPMGLPILDSSHIPGPGKLIDEEDEWYYSDGSDASVIAPNDEDLEHQPESPPPQVDVEAAEKETSSYFPPVEDIAPDEIDPLPYQFFRRGPWQDSARFPGVVKTESQPPTANHAMVYFEKKALQFETASRSATWGTRRRLSDSEVGSILDGTQVSRHLSLKDTFASNARARKNSILKKAREMRRSSSFLKKQNPRSRNHSPEENVEQVASPVDDGHRGSISSLRTSQQISNWGKSKSAKSPPANSVSAVGAMMVMSGQLGAVGGSSAAVVAEPEPVKGPRFSLKRNRSKSDNSKAPKPAAGISEMWKSEANPIGPTIPPVASPQQMRGSAPRPPSYTENDDNGDDAELDDDEVGIKMEFAMQPLDIEPTLEGFRTQVRRLNPRLEPYLVDRIATDQVRRYKKLVKSRVEHITAVQVKRNCMSGVHCQAMGGKATILPPRTSAKDANVAYAQFRVAGNADSEGDESAFTEGIVTPALFPPGIPLPPTTHLPAEFECSLCFQVKRFQKPSDWTKHVHEDVQPFTCTFPNCPDPKPFKRKADWVRHENERHRHLERWHCSIPECHHVCYRKDNFVQHLVREHKMTEPKAGKTNQAGGTRARAPSRGALTSGQSQDSFWTMVQSCRRETVINPKSESCKFCGNVCNTWKKLSVHVGKHMEQIAMPVLGLADKVAVSPDTIVSPIEAPPTNRSINNTMLDTNNLTAPNQYQGSPYHTSVHSFAGSSAGHSPSGIPSQPVIIGTSMSEAMFAGNVTAGHLHGMDGSTEVYGNGPTMESPFHHYGGYDNVNEAPYMNEQNTGAFSQATSENGQPAVYHQNMMIPRSQPINNDDFESMNMNSLGANIYQGQQFYAANAATATYVNAYHPGMTHNVQSGGPSSRGHTPVQANQTYYQENRQGNGGSGYYQA